MTQNVWKCKQMFKTFWNVNRCSGSKRSKRFEMNPSPTFRSIILWCSWSWQWYYEKREILTPTEVALSCRRGPVKSQLTDIFLFYKTKWEQHQIHTLENPFILMKYNLNFCAIFYIIANFSWRVKIQKLAGTIYLLHFPTYI